MSVENLSENSAPDLLAVLLHFRSTHPLKEVVVARLPWRFVACGQVAETVVLLPGGAGLGEAWFRVVLGLEKHWRVIAPTSAPERTMARFVEAVVGW